MARWRVVLVEDDDLTRTRLARVVRENSAFELSGTAADCKQGRAALADFSPDLLVTDLGLPDGSGLDLIRLARESLPKCQIMVITVFGDETNVIAALAAGANGYLLKDGTGEEIDEALLELLNGGSPMSAPIARHLLRRFRASERDSRPAEPTQSGVSLTEREVEVLRLVAKGFSVAEIARLLEISHHTVTTYVRRMYKKLEVSSRSAAVYEAVNLGIIRIED